MWELTCSSVIGWLGLKQDMDIPIVSVPHVSTSATDGNTESLVMSELSLVLHIEPSLSLISNEEAKELAG